MKPNVLILYTGGTIGMADSAEGYVPCAQFNQLLKKKLSEYTQQQLLSFDVQELPELIDSANLQPEHWTQMARLLIDNWDCYDGFVVLHGTDTMVYSAAALSYMLLGLDKPVILTGSQMPLINLRSDGLDNLITAIELAGNSAIPEVCIYFNSRLLRGNRSIKLNSNAFDAFDSPNFPALARAGIRLTVDSNLLLKPRQKQYCAPAFYSDAVTVLPIYPGISAAIADALLGNGTVKGLIIHSYGSGNIPSDDSDLVAALQRANDSGVVIVNVTQCIEGPVNQGDYATGAVLNRIGVVSGKDITLASAFAKLHFLIACGLGADDIRDRFSVPLCGEMSE